MHTSAEPVSFGALLYRFRRRLGISQAKAASVAGLSPGYYSELENSKRPAPPERTALRLARSLELRPLETSDLLAAAAAERSGLEYSSDLPKDVCSLLIAIRRNASRLSPKLVDAMRATIEEAGM